MRGQSYGGGSAPTAASAAWTVSRRPAFVIAPLGADFPVGEFQGNVDFSLSPVVAEESNRFLVENDGDSYVLSARDYLTLPESWVFPLVGHLHVSCRGGVEFLSALAAARYRTASIDVMQPSLCRLGEGISAAAVNAGFLFCNRLEWEMIRALHVPLPRHLFVLRTDAEGVDVMLGGDSLRVASVSVDPSMIVSTVGAGDSFLGGFLAAFVAGGALSVSLNAGIAAATTAVQGFGPSDLLSAHEQVSELRAQLDEKRVYRFPSAIVRRFAKLQDQVQL